jgi:two-component system, cell cycle response regulator DivK
VNTLPTLTGRRPKAGSSSRGASRRRSIQPVRTRPLTILVVDDSHDVCAMYAQHFRHKGATVLTARDGVEALQLTYLYHPDAVLLDMAMPRLTGWEVASTLKKEDRTKNIPVVALTGQVFPGAKELALRTGADLYLTKPCMPDVAYATILELVGGPPPNGSRGAA